MKTNEPTKQRSRIAYINIYTILMYLLLSFHCCEKENPNLNEKLDKQLFEKYSSEFHDDFLSKDSFDKFKKVSNVSKFNCSEYEKTISKLKEKFSRDNILKDNIKRNILVRKLYTEYIEEFRKNIKSILKNRISDENLERFIDKEEIQNIIDQSNFIYFANEYKKFRGIIKETEKSGESNYIPEYQLITLINLYRFSRIVFSKIVFPKKLFPKIVFSYSLFEKEGYYSEEEINLIKYYCEALWINSGEIKKLSSKKEMDEIFLNEYLDGCIKKINSNYEENLKSIIEDILSDTIGEFIEESSKETSQDITNSGQSSGDKMDEIEN